MCDKNSSISFIVSTSRIRNLVNNKSIVDLLILSYFLNSSKILIVYNDNFFFPCNGNNHQTNEQENGESNTEQNTTETNEVKNNNEENESQETNNQTTGIGGANTNEEVIATASEDSSEKTQMQIDAQYIKENFDIGLPLQGQITSRYGKREPTEIISENHQGIDIGVDEGTSIVAAMEGKVTVVSNEGDYGTHVKIVNQDITTIYAHCSKILVKEGETVKKGQQIALSGNTGNTTGPHLHFEIRREDRTVDPELVVSWAKT